MNENAPLKVLWLDKVKDEHIDSAIDYLSLFFGHDELEEIRNKLMKHEKDLSIHKAKDLLRAAGLTPLPETDIEVAGHLKKIHAGEALHPIILVTINEKLYIADGFHRTCACYIIGDDTNVSGEHIEL